jgi:predicted glycosyltransferase
VRIWVDLENLPDVPFFAPILRALESEGHRIHLTARRERDLTELCARKGWRLDALVGRHYGRSRLLKTAGGLVRALGLVRAVRAFRPDLLVNFTSRPAILAAAALRAPIFTFFDYEHVALPLVGRLSGRVCVPEAAAHAAAARLGLPEDRLARLPGTKEDVYSWDFTPTPMRAALGIPGGAVFTLLRPPAVSAHYHEARSEAVFDALLGRIALRADVHARVLSRDADDRRKLEARFADHPRIRHLDATGDGLNLIWNADLVVSGGGTMTREAAALGIPAYSVFTGAVGAVDQRLFDEGRITHITSPEDLDRALLTPAVRPVAAPSPRQDLVAWLVRGILETGARTPPTRRDAAPGT